MKVALFVLALAFSVVSVSAPTWCRADDSAPPVPAKADEKKTDDKKKDESKKDEPKKEPVVKAQAFGGVGVGTGMGGGGGAMTYGGAGIGAGGTATVILPGAFGYGTGMANAGGMMGDGGSAAASTRFESGAYLHLHYKAIGVQAGGVVNTLTYAGVSDTSGFDSMAVAQISPSFRAGISVMPTHDSIIALNGVLAENLQASRSDKDGVIKHPLGDKRLGTGLNVTYLGPNGFVSGTVTHTVPCITDGRTDFSLLAAFLTKKGLYFGVSTDFSVVDGDASTKMVADQGRVYGSGQLVLGFGAGKSTTNVK